MKNKSLKITLLLKSILWDNFMDDHVWNFDVHLLGVWKVNTVKVNDSLLEKLLHGVKLRISSGFDQSVMNLPYVDFMVDFLSFHPAKTSFTGFKCISKLFSVWWSISNVKDVSQGWGSR